MIYEKIELCEKYGSLKNSNSTAYLRCMVPHFLPEMNRTDEKRPCMLILPGGGYGFCSEREAEPVAVHFMELGFNTYILYYSVYPNHNYPLQLNEVAAAFDTIKELSAAHHSDPERIGIMGFSAGGHLAAHYSTSFDSPAVRQNFKDSIRPFASVLCYPVITADEKYSHRGSFENLLGEYPSGEKAKQFSCEELVKENTPQCFIWHTAEDDCVPVENSLMYAKALSKYKIPYELHIYPYGGHGFATSDRVTSNGSGEVLNHVHNWLEALKKWVAITF